MSSIIEAILQATVGLLVNKGRDVAAEKLKHGDVTDQKFRDLVVRELDDIKSKIDGLARKDLLASVSFFEQGLVFLYQLLAQPKLQEVTTATTRGEIEEEKLAVSLPSASGESKISVKTLVEELKVLTLNETAKQLLADAKKRFEDARRRATDAFSNEGLRVSDRVLAMKIRIMATLIEQVNSPSTALASCVLCLQELHSIPAVQSYFEVEVTKPMKYRFNKNERREQIAEVCHMNFVVYSFKRMVDHDGRYVFKLPVIGKLKIDPLRDAGLNKALSEFRLERCRLRDWTFGQKGEENHRLCEPVSIATNTQGQFIVADRANLNVFDLSGKFLRSICPLTEDEQKYVQFKPYSIATDGNDNLCVLVSLNKGYREEWRGVYVFDQPYNLYHRFPLWREDRFHRRLTVTNDGRVFLLLWHHDAYQVDVYETDGRFLYSFGQGILSSLRVRDITTVNDNMVMVLDCKANCVHVFSTQGDHLRQFAVQVGTVYGFIAFHQPSEHVIVNSEDPDNGYYGKVSIYTKDGEFVRSVQLDKVLIGLTVTVDGRVAVTSDFEYKVHIISF